MSRWEDGRNGFQKGKMDSQALGTKRLLIGSASGGAQLEQKS